MGKNIFQIAKLYYKNRVIIIYLVNLLLQFSLVKCLKGGTAATPLPYIVSVQMLHIKYHHHMCVGTIIHKNFVLTAAHCLMKARYPDELSVVAGDNALNTKTEKRRYQVVKYIKHEHFYPLKGYDIALLKIQPEFKFDGKHLDKINYKANLPMKEGNNDTYLIGWGKTNTKASKTLELVPFLPIDNLSCIQKYGYMYVTDTELCAIAHQQRGACDGDSGGPLMDNSMSTQLGILSYGTSVCTPNKIYVFTSLRPLIKWINSKIGAD